MMHTNLLFSGNWTAVGSMLAATPPGCNEITLLPASRICLCFSSRSFASRMRSTSLCLLRSIFSKPSLYAFWRQSHSQRTHIDFNTFFGKFHAIRFRGTTHAFNDENVIYLIHAGNVLRCAASRVDGIKSTLSN